MTNPVTKKSTILVVDDEDALRTVLSGELANEGYDVKAAADGDEAIGEVEKTPFDLVLLDIKMPRVNGFEVLKFIKEKHAKTKVVMLTGFADLKNAIESKKLGRRRFCKQAVRPGRSADHNRACPERMTPPAWEKNITS